MKNILKIVLIITAVVLGYFVYRSVDGFVDFHNEKMNRYVVAVEQMQDLALAEKLYKGYNGEYTDNLDSLKHFIQNGKIYSIIRKDSSAYVFDERKRIDVMKNFTIIDTVVSPVSVKDSIFGKRSNALENFGYVPVNGEKHPIKLYASFNDRIIGEDSTNIQRDHFFMGTIEKNKVLSGLDQELIGRELADNTSPIRSDVIKVGSDSRPSLEGNWSTDVDLALQAKKDQEKLREMRSK